MDKTLIFIAIFSIVTNIAYCQNNACGANPCRNGATCVEARLAPFYVCLCTGNWMGQNCNDPDIYSPSSSFPCNQNFYLDRSGNITSPGWPNFYGIREFCLYSIKVPTALSITLNIDFFVSERYKDELFIARGPLFPGFFDRSLRSLNGTVQDGTLNVAPIRFEDTNQVTLLWESDFNINRTGFRLSFEADIDNCWRNQCQVGSVCRDLLDDSDYECICPDDRTGRFCESGLVSITRTQPTAFVTGGFLIEGVGTVAIPFDLALTPLQLSTFRVTGLNLWRVTASLSSRSSRGGDYVSVIPALSFTQGSTIWNPPDITTLFGIQVTFPVAGFTCSDTQYLCATIDRSPTADFVIRGDPTNSSLTGCTQINCRGVEISATRIIGLDPVNIRDGTTVEFRFNVALDSVAGTGSVQGNSLWRVNAFASSVSDGSLRIGDEDRLLLSSEASRAGVVAGSTTTIRGLEAGLDFRNLNCVQLKYFCVEVMRDTQGTPFTLTGVPNDNVLVTCEEVNCGAVQIIRTSFTSNGAATLLGDSALNNINLDLSALSLTTSGSVSGTNLWQVDIFTNTQIDGSGRTAVTRTATLQPSAANAAMSQGGQTLVLRNVQANLDLTGVPCSEVQYICARLRRNPLSQPEFVLEGIPTDSVFVTCQGYSCSELRTCDDIICQNGGTCNNNNNNPRCICAPGWTGPLCSQAVDACDGVVCLFGGTCINNRVDFICLCTLGRRGTLCELEDNGVTVISVSPRIQSGSLREGFSLNALNLDVAIQSDANGDTIAGTGLWNVEFYLTARSDGGGQRYDLQTSPLNSLQASTAISAGSTSTIRGIFTTGNLQTLTCPEVRYICAELSKGNNPNPDFLLTGSLAGCTEITCQGVEIVDSQLSFNSPPSVVERSPRNPLTFDFSFTSETTGGSVTGDNLWNLVYYLSTRPDDTGVTQTIPVTLSALQSGMDISAGNTATLRSITAQINTLQYTCQEFGYICVRLEENPSASIDFTLSSRDARALSDCVQIACRGVEVSRLSPSNLFSNGLSSGTSNFVNFNLGVTTSPTGASVSGTDLWTVEVFTNTNINGDGTTLVSTTATLPRSTLNQGIAAGTTTSLSGIQASLDLRSLTCAQVPFVCVRLVRNQFSNPDFSLAHANGGDQIVQCQQYTCQDPSPCQNNVCQNGATCVVQDNGFACICTDAFVGQLCETVNPCFLSNPCLNNGRCIAVNGGFTCQCVNGYTGLNCQIPPDPCLSSPCQNFGTCTRLADNRFACLCLPFFEGEFCQLEDPCRGNPCGNNAQCLGDAQQGTFQCICLPGSKGDSCQYPEPCFSSPCRNNGVCSSTPTGSQYTCNCQTGFQGVNCQIPDPCASNPCSNGGTCDSSPNGASYNCICPPFIFGDICQFVDPCNSNPCLNNGLCQRDPQGSQYTCICLGNFLGNNCQYTNPCSPTSPCLNNGVCQILDDGASFECNCQPNFLGDICQNRNPCLSNPCRNGGTCRTILDGSTFICDCPSGFFGLTCVTSSICATVPCRNGGTCTPIAQGTDFSCQCPPGFLLPDCRTRDACSNQPCQNQGTCVSNNDGTYSCICRANFLGVNCENPDPCSSNPCQRGGTCMSQSQGLFYSCECPPNTFGVNCDIIDPCSSNPCINGGTCQRSSDLSAFQCFCREGYTGPTCAVLVPCDIEPCRFGGTCIPDATQPNGFQCLCVPGRTGSTCTEVDLCASLSPCLNSSTCIPNTAEGTFMCICTPAYTGTRCNIEVPCFSNPCLNGGLCVPSGTTYQCLCRSPYEGQNCQFITPTPSPNQCTNPSDYPCSSGECISGQQQCDQVINCQDGYSDEVDCPKPCRVNMFACQDGLTCIANALVCDGAAHCGDASDESLPRCFPCSSNPCRNGGLCEVAPDGSSYQCICLEGFTGPTCEGVVNPTNDPPQFVSRPAIFISEGTLTNDLVFTLQARDVNGDDLQFGLRGDNANTYFFMEDLTSGRLLLRRTLDREVMGDSFNFTAVVRDDRGAETEQIITVFIEDINDNDPVITNLPARIRLPEDSPREEIYQVTATDLDLGQGSELSKSIESVTLSSGAPDPGNLFAINGATGSVFLTHTLDFETNQQYVINIRVSDLGTPSLVAFGTLTVDVDDVQDLGPIFINLPYDLTIQETHQVGSVVQTVVAEDQDTVAPRPVSYRFVIGNDQGYFNLNPNTGALTLARPLDRDDPTVPESFMVTVRAEEVGSPTDFDFNTFTITVLDVQDEPPSFNQDNFETTIPEDDGVGTVLPFNIRVTDMDRTTADFISLELEGPDDLPFSISPLSVTNEGSVLISVARPLDYETTQNYIFMLIARESNPSTGESFAATSTVTVNLRDVNDNDPVYGQGPFMGSVTEGATRGTFVTTVSATDIDSNQNAQIIFNIVAGNEQGLFQIDSSNGRITTQSPFIDFETSQMRYTLIIEATNPTQPVLPATGSSQAQVIIDIVDTNDNSPIFDQINYNSSVTELAEPGFTIIRVLATDVDSGAGGEVRYSINGGNGDARFEIDEVTGDITLRAAVDREIRDFYSLTIVATDQTDPNNIGLTTVDIHVRDFNDNNPVWRQTSYSMEVSEGATGNTFIVRVEADDADIGANSRLTYSLSPDNQLFRIDPETGEIFLIGSLDRETMEEVTINVIVTDNGNPRRPASSPATVVVRVTDTNDNAPVFVEDPYSFQVEENRPRNTPVGQVFFTDVDQTGMHTFSFLTDIEGFLINPSTGEIFTTEVFDRESQSVYQFEVVVFDGVAMATTTVNVTITDVNDADPVFDPAEYSATIPEDFPILTEILSVFATDMDQVNDGDITFRFESGRNVEGPFSLDRNTGLLEIISSLDRELESLYTLTVLAVDTTVGGIQRTGTTMVLIDVTDINDNGPRFTQNPYPEETVAEDVGEGVAIVQVATTDTDLGNNSLVDYRITQGNVGNVFTIDQNGIISRGSTPLDRETLDFYLLVVEAFDPSNPALPTDSTVVRIAISDINDVIPRFTQSFYSRLDLTEDTEVGTRVIDVRAMDQDLGPAGEIRYQIVAGDDNGYFEIDPVSGLITVESSFPSITETMTFNLTVLATDQSSPFNVGTAYVIVDILDAGEIAPVFILSRYEVDSVENQPEGTFIVTVEALVEGREANLRYSLDPNAHPDVMRHFDVNEVSGEITIKEPLDREAIDFFAFTVFATGETISGSTAVWVTVLDANDNTPAFIEFPEDVTILEGLPAQTVIGELRTTDADINQNALVNYRISDGNREGAFTLRNMLNGIVTLITTRPLNREFTDEYNITITAFDSGDPSLEFSQTVRITVGDTNDNAPLFTTSSFSGSIIENFLSSSPIANLTVSDNDMALSNNLRFTIIQGNQEGKFEVNSQGEIILTSALDRETTDSYQLTVRLEDPTYDPRYQVFVPVYIQVLDENDNPPVFSRRSYQADVGEGLSSVIVTTVAATDADLGPNSEIRFNVTGDNAEFFSIDPIQGHLITNVELDREMIDEYIVTVTATDQALDPMNRLTSTTLVTVDVTDINDTPPSFLAEQYGPYSVLEESPNAFIDTIQAFDPDLDRGGTVTFSLIGQYRDNFVINPFTGLLTVNPNRPLDYEQVQQVNITVVARDAEGLQATTDITVNVININDNSPRFEGAPYSFSISENVTVGTLAFIAAATDADLGLPGVVTYSIIDGNTDRVFWINPNNGEIYINETLDRETTAGYVLVLEARDNPENSDDTRVTTTRLTITVSDADDVPPTFPNDRYLGTILENAFIGTLVDMERPIQALDSDEIGSIVYSINGDGSEAFTIDDLTGELRSLEVFDREVRSVYNFTVRASDSRGSYDEAEAYITVLDENDNEPTLDLTVYNYTIPENSPPGFGVGQLSATDGDGDTVTFSLVSGGEDLFLIDPETGRITVAPRAVLDREVRSSYTLTVSVTDQGSPQLTTTGTVNINLSDLNDSPPVFEETKTTVTISELDRESFLGIFTANDLDLDALIRYFINSVTILDNNGRDISTQIDFSTWFRIDETTGEVVLVEQIDREAISEITVVISAVDENGDGESGMSNPNSMVRILITDTNDNAPVIQPIDVKVLQEESSVGTIITTVIAEDPDQGEGGQVTYMIVNGDDLPIMIDPDTGVITVSETIDREISSWVNFTIIVKDGGAPSLNSTVDVNLRITDINDNNPVFDQTVYTASVNESAPRGECFTYVVANDTDAGDFGAVTYSLSGGDGLFGIDSETGEICLLGQLDRESVNQYTLIITAKDSPRGSPNNRRETSTTVVVDVTDTNEFPPRSDFEFPFTLPEGEPPGTVVGTIEAVDPDTPDEPLIYIIGDIQPPGAENIFTINNRTGEVILISEIDSDNASFSDEYRINIIISDGGNPEQTTTVVSVITIVDLNDTPPTFDQNQYNTSVSEDFETRNPVIQVSATDPDQDSVLTYMIVDGNGDDSFLISSDTGEIRFLGTFDHELRQVYQLIVSVKDQDGLESRVPVEIHVRDINDNEPRFTRSLYTFSVCENEPNGTEVGQIVALDNDLLMDNRVIRYSITSGNGDGSLEVDPETGVITTTRPYDSEVEDGFTLTVEARNHLAQEGVRADTAVVQVVIIDKNDNTPIFERTDYSQNIQETDTGTVEALFAQDIDMGNNGIVAYRIIEGNTLDIFSIGENTGHLTLTRPVSSLAVPVFEFMLVVEAYDRGTPSRASNVTVFITVGDDNDRAPIFLVPRPGQIFELPENQDPGYFIVRLNATDQDLGSNGEITYTFFTSGTSSGDYFLFTLNRTTGILLANFTADREVRSQYTLVVLASDQGSPPRATPLQIIIQITDENDNDPSFPLVNGMPTAQEVPPVFENTTRFTAIINVTRAVDPDINSTIYYYIVSGNEGGIFIINPVTGEITLNGTLDRETRDIYNIIIKASGDSDYQPTSGPYDVATDFTLKEVVIRVGDVNDNLPAFPGTLIVTGVSLDAQIGTTVITIQARDPDASSDIMYNLVSTSFVRGNDVTTLDRPVFTIDPITGRITTLTTFVGSHLDGYFLLVIRAVDKSTRAFVETRVQIQVFERDQQVAVIIDGSVEEVTIRRDEIIRILSNITGGDVRIDDIGVYVDENGVRDVTRTQIYFHVIDTTTGNVVDAETVVRAIDTNSQSIETLVVGNDVIDVFPVVTGAAAGGIGWLGALLLALALLLFLGALLFIILLCCLPLWLGRGAAGGAAAAAAARKKKVVAADSYDGQVNRGFDDIDIAKKEYEYQEQVMNFAGENMYHVDQAQDALIMTSMVGSGGKRELYSMADGSSLTSNGYIGDAGIRSSHVTSEEHRSMGRVGTINRDGSVSVQTDEAAGRVGGTFPRMQETSFIEDRSYSETQRSASTLGRDQSSSGADYGRMVTNEIDREELKKQTAAEIRELLHSRSLDESSGSQQFSTSTARFDDVNRSVTVSVGYDEDEVERGREFVTSSADFSSSRQGRSHLDGGQSVAVIDVGYEEDRIANGGVNHVNSYRGDKRLGDPMSDFGGDQSSFHEEHFSREYEEEDMLVSEEHHTSRQSSRKDYIEDQPRQRSEIIDEFIIVNDDEPYFVDEPSRAGSHYGDSRANSHYGGGSRAGSHYGDRRGSFGDGHSVASHTLSMRSEEDDRGHYNTGTMSTTGGGNWSSTTDFDNYNDQGEGEEIIEERKHVKKVRRSFGPQNGVFRHDAEI